VSAIVAVSAVVYMEVCIWLLPDDQRHLRHYWPLLALTMPAMLWLASRSAQAVGYARVPLWCGILVADLFAMSWPLVEVHHEQRIYLSSRTLEFLASRRQDGGRVLDVYALGYLSPLGCGAPAALNLGLYPVRGYNPLDFYRYKHYLQMVSGAKSPSAPCEVVNGFPITNRRLLDLLGVRYLLAPSDRPPADEAWQVAFDDPEEAVSFNYPHHGMHILPPYTVYENREVMPRAFVVPTAAPLPSGGEEEAMLATDFTKTVLVEGCDPACYPTGSGESFRPARILEYLPNSVRIAVSGNEPGWLVLTDMWFPGWTCTVDGKESPIFPGNYLFRAVPVPAGEHELAFRFRPRSFALGWKITVGTLFVLTTWGVVSMARAMRRKAPKGVPSCVPVLIIRAA